MGGEKYIIITTTDIEGVHEEPPMPKLALIMGDYRGKEIDPLVA